MSDPINFEIDALLARYELHPERRDIFVEGEHDQALIRSFLYDQGQTDISVFPISVVNVPPGQVLARSLPHPSNRSAVITLAFEFEKNSISPQQALCIADADS